MVFKAVHHLTNLILAVACFMGVLALTTDANRWYTASLLAVVVTTLASVALQWKGSKRDQRIGRWDEQEYVLMSMLEAMERGMSQREWLDGYVEHAAADRADL